MINKHNHIKHKDLKWDIVALIRYSLFMLLGVDEIPPEGGSY